jgi:phosphoglycolate phosphatase-like HAD superfamily hydrolase
MRALAVDLDGALGDTRKLWRDWLVVTAPLLGVDPARLPADRGDAAERLDEAGAGNWRVLLERFAEDRAPVYLRPNAEIAAALRRLEASGTRLGAFTDAPEELARIALAQVGATRRLEAVEAGPQAVERLRELLGGDVEVVRSRNALLARA